MVGIIVISLFALRNNKSKTLAPTTTPTNTTSSNTPSSTSTTATTTNQPSGASSSSAYKDGVYKGSVANAYYGNVQVSVDIQNGKIASVNFLQYPNLDSTSVYIAQQVMPYLKQEAIKAQSAHVNLITGATFTSQAFVQSLTAALQKA